MNAVVWLLGGVLTLVVLVVGKVLGDLASKEVQGRLDQVPLALLRVARWRLPVEFREVVHDEWWLPDLQYLMESEADRPITRLIRGVRFAASQILSARRTATAMGAASVWMRRTASVVKLVISAVKLASAAISIVGFAVAFVGGVAAIAAILIPVVLIAAPIVLVLYPRRVGEVFEVLATLRLRVNFKKRFFSVSYSRKSPAK